MLADIDAKMDTPKINTQSNYLYILRFLQT
jgi:hypothetical protein